jgi:vacuolar-type H+-ATPase subunit I/STV1
MGYKKLDEVMELLTDELDGFNKALAKLQRLTKNVEDIKIIPDTSEIEGMLETHLRQEKEKTSRLRESVRSLEERLKRASVISKFQKWVQYFIWAVTLIIIGYLSFKVSRIQELQEESFELGQKEIIENLQGYFGEHPEHYEKYLQWDKEKDSLPNKK